MKLNDVTFEIKQVHFEEVKKCVKHNCNKVLRKDGSKWDCPKCNIEYVRKCKHKKKIKEQKKVNIDIKVEKNNNFSDFTNSFDILIKKAFIDNDKDSLNAIIKVALEKLSQNKL